MGDKRAKFKAGATVALKSSPFIKLTIHRAVHQAGEYMYLCKYWDETEGIFKSAYLPEIVLDKYIPEEDNSKKLGYTTS